jgi:hypothetical protein
MSKPARMIMVCSLMKLTGLFATNSVVAIQFRQPKGARLLRLRANSRC